MKKFFIFAVAVCATFVVSCQKEETLTAEKFTFTATVGDFCVDGTKYSLSSDGHYDLSKGNWLSLRTKAQHDAEKGGKPCMVNVDSFDATTRTAVFSIVKFNNLTTSEALEEAKGYFLNSSEMTLTSADDTYGSGEDPFKIRDDSFFTTRVYVKQEQKAKFDSGKAVPTKNIPLISYWKGTEAEKGKPVFDLKIAGALLKLHIDVEEGESVEISKITISNGNVNDKGEARNSHLASNYYWKCENGVYSFKGATSLGTSVSLVPESGSFTASGDYYFAIAVHNAVNTISKLTVKVDYKDGSSDEFTNPTIEINKSDIKLATIYNLGAITVPKSIL